MHRILFVSLLCLSTMGCWSATQNANSPVKQADLGQGWTQADRDWWYKVSQGSRLLPLKWAQHLELKDSTETFLSDSHIARLNYLTEHNGWGLPIGFVVDTNSDDGKTGGACVEYPSLCDGNRHFAGAWADFPRQQWLGLNCAACHTNDITYHKNPPFRVDGAATLGDFERMLDDLRQALAQTSSDQTKFDRFASNVLPAGSTPADKANLHVELNAVLGWEQRLAAQNAVADIHDEGRLDAQGHILNKIAMIVGGDPQLPTPSTAPASYPFIWDAPIEDRVQWNGIAKNDMVITVRNLQTREQRQTGIGALGRNVGEVLGVFADVNVYDPDGPAHGYKSTAQVGALLAIEGALGTLQSPKWPAFLGKIDPDKKALGEKIYKGEGIYADTQKGNCVSCHDDKRNTASRIYAHMQSLATAGTDIWLACNTFNNTSNTGRLNGRPTLPFASTVFGAQSPTVVMLQNSAIGAIVEDAGAIAQKVLDDLFGKARPSLVHALVTRKIEYLPGISDPAKKALAQKCITQSQLSNYADQGLAYKARPLDGIWATAPYLHNGSVPTLYDLLLPATVRNSRDLTAAPQQTGVMCDDGGKEHPCTRPEDFSVGSHEFDTVKVGFVSTPNLPNTSEFRVRDANGTPILGNYNSGHDYGEKLNDAERWALIEYLKGL
ncbi:MAG: di-heme-cytochrome C peroxidase [Rhizomicrobium sp.]